MENIITIARAITKTAAQNKTLALQKYIVKVVNNGKEVLCSEARNLMDSLVEVAPHAVPKGCHGGGCGVCKVQVVSGKTRKLVMSIKHVSETDHEKGIGLACRLFPQSDIELRFIGKGQK